MGPDRLPMLLFTLERYPIYEFRAGMVLINPVITFSGDDRPDGEQDQEWVHSLLVLAPIF